MQLLPGYCRG